MTLTIELTPEQEEALKMIANAAGMEPGEYVKQALLGEPDPNQGIHLGKAEASVLIAMIDDLKKTGESINRSLDRMNGAARCPPSIKAETVAELKVQQARYEADLYHKFLDAQVGASKQNPTDGETRQIEK